MLTGIQIISHRNVAALILTYLVDLGVVDNFVGDIDFLVREAPAGLICHAHSPLNTPAVAISLGKLNSDITLLPDVALFTHLSNKASRGVTNTVVLHLLLALRVVVWLASVATGLVEGTTNGAAIDLLLSCA